MPEDGTALTLCHEIIHDYFYNCVAGAAFRDLLVKEALQEIESVNLRLGSFSVGGEGFFGREGKLPEDAKYFEEVAKRCTEKVAVKDVLQALNGITDIRYTGLPFPVQLFVQEIVAYAGSTMAMQKTPGGVGEEEMGTIPEKLKNTIEQQFLAHRSAKKMSPHRKTA
jgi:hypothetical protein